MAPLAQAALNQIGYTETLDQAVCDAFFAEVDDDGNGQIDKTELPKFMKSLMWVSCDYQTHRRGWKQTKLAKTMQKTNLSLSIWQCEWTAYSKSLCVALHSNCKPLRENLFFNHN